VRTYKPSPLIVGFACRWEVYRADNHPPWWPLRLREDVVMGHEGRYTREEVERIAERHRTWGRWGDDDELGAANLVTAETVLRAASLVRSGKVFSLALDMDRTGPQDGTSATGRTNPQHYMARDGGDIAAASTGTPQFDGTDDLVVMYMQASTQWDSLAHAFYDNQMYNGRGTQDVTSAGALRNGISNFRDRALGRGVLLDVPRSKGRVWLDDGEPVTAGDLERCVDLAGVEIGEGDFVLVRTGQLAHCRERGDWGGYAKGLAPGLSLDAAEYLCPRGVVGVATDTWGMEVMPSESDDVRAPVHVVFLVNAGVHVGEMWDMEELAADCAADGVCEFFLCAPPLPITGAVGSPVNPIAVK